jgi:hypothetical protein
VTAATATKAPGRGWVAIAVVLLAVVGLVLVSGPGGSGEPYDLDDAGPTGYKGLRLLLEDQGATVDRIGARDVDETTAATTDVVFVPVAVGVPADVSERWRSFVTAGGTLVLGTPVDLGSSSVNGFGFDVVAMPPGVCDIARLQDAEEIDPAGTIEIDVPAEAESCYGDGTSALIVSEDEGSGEVVTLSGPELFTNDAMRPHDQEVDDPKAPMQDNVVVATRLLNPGGAARIAVVTSGLEGAVQGGDESFSDLIRPGVKLGIWQLVAAFVLYAWYRGRRLGRVVTEPHPVPIAASELVGAVGNLMQRRRDPGRAAQLLRRETVGELAVRLGVPRSTDPSIVAAMIAGRTGRDPDAVLAVLSTRPVTTDDELLGVSSQLEAIRQEVLHGRRATTD